MSKEESKQENGYLYRWLLAGGMLVIFLCVIIVIAAVDAWFGQKTLEQSGQQGDYFGGHFGPIFGAFSLIVVVFASYKQHQQQRAFFLKQESENARALFYQSFTHGIGLISEWDRKESGCRQAMRLVDYYSKLAIERDEPELFRLLNTVITEKIRDTLRGKGAEDWHGEQIVLNYPFAIIALNKIANIRRSDVEKFKDKNRDELKDRRTEIRELRKKQSSNS
ncbi:MAG TPA: hypothetical protein PKZ97_14055 [Azospirillaceae bacterium]|nr:hypothetical protein [Azospirillaceae bacterium]HRQ82231.1 hypothetical protein [Azospirillaceae bacterium]